MAIFFMSNAYALEIYKDDQNSVALRGFFSGLYINSDTSDEISDAGSRWGIDYTRAIENDWTVGLTLEWGLNFENNKNFTLNGSNQAPQGSSDDVMFARLGYISFSHDDYGTIGIGKQWAAYFDATAGTDVFNYWVNLGSGAFNLNSDGGISGTGRAEQSIVWRKTYGNLKLAAQVQAKDEPVVLELDPNSPGFGLLNGETIATVGNGYGFSAMYAWQNFTLGFGHNNNEIELAPIVGGGSEDDVISAVSLTYGTFGTVGFYASAMAAQSENHEIDNTGRYFDALGSEFVLRYQFDSGFAPYVGFNRVEEDDSSYLGEYEFHVNIIGADYLLQNLHAKLFAEVAIHDTTYSLGNEFDETEFVIGATFFLF